MAGALYLIAPESLQRFTYVLFPIAASLVAFNRWRRHPDECHCWLLFAIAFALFAVADGLYDIAYSHFPGPADVVYLAAFGMAIAAAFGMRDRHNDQGRLHLIRTVDASIVGASVLCIIWVTWVDPAGRVGEASTSEMLLALSYPVLDLALLTILVSGGRLKGPRLWLIAGSIPFLVGDLWYSVAALEGTYRVGMWADSLWLGAYVVWGAAAFTPVNRSEPPELVPKGWARVLVNSSLIVLALVLGSHALIRGHVHVEATILTTVTIASLMVLRLEITQRRLLQSLRRAAVGNEELLSSVDNAEALRRHNQLILDSAAEGIIGVDDLGKGTFANAAAVALLGYSTSELIGKQVHALVHHSRQDGSSYPFTECPVYAAVSTGVPSHVDDDIFFTKDGRKLRVEYSATPIWEGESIVGAVVSFRDVTHYLELQEQFRQSQKLEAVARLAGGIAHDFNNLLAVILNYTELAREDLEDPDPRKEDIDAIAEAADRAVLLVRQLLAFSRKDLAAPEIVDVNESVSEVEKLLRRVIGEDIDLQLLSSPDPLHVLIDSGHFEQILMNLVVNARDAMPTGGVLTLRTSLSRDSDVVIEVSDTGIGMSEEVRSHLFEPFFTTKGPSQGTGLGLATVYGIVTQAGGTIRVLSEVGKGTTLRVTLARVGAELDMCDGDRSLVAPRGHESILLVEDEKHVRDSTARLLRMAGYAVTSTASPDEAIELAQTSQRFDLVLTDVILPGMSGPELVEHLIDLAPGCTVVFMSGYTDDVVQRSGAMGNGHPLLQKPFTRLALLTTVRQQLDDERSSPEVLYE